MADDAKQRITGFGTIDLYVGKENEIVIKQENYHDDDSFVSFSPAIGDEVIRLILITVNEAREAARYQVSAAQSRTV